MKKNNFLILALLNSNFVFADCIPFKEEHKAEKYRISEIVLDIENIFNLDLDGEKTGFHKTANKLHTKTKKNIISRELLFEENEVIENRVLAESERVLRSKPFVKDATIKPIAKCDDGIVVKVITKDNWSLQPSVSFGTSGGKSKYSFEIQEKNLFGFGKSLEFKYKRGIERKEKSIRYNDPNLLGSNKRLELSYQNNSDGERQYFELIQPFTSLQTKSFWGINHLKWDLVRPIYQNGEVFEEFGQSIKKNEVKLGRLVKSNDNNFHRLYFGMTSDENKFLNTQNYPITLLPEDRDYQYPWVAYEFFNETMPRFEAFFEEYKDVIEG